MIHFLSERRLVFLGAVIWLSLSACVSARMSDHETDRYFRDGKYDTAIARLKKGLEKQGEDGRDTLLYLLDLGLALHSAGKYEESNQAFLKADKIAEIKDYTSISKEAATLLTSDNIKDYKGEDFEKVLISTYLAINYALMGHFEDALVEARRVNHKLFLLVSQGEKKYKQNAFARYLSAILYEQEGDYNDAYVDYKKTYELVPDFPNLKQDLWHCAWILKIPDEMERWDKTFGLTQQDHIEAKKLGPKSPLGEIIVIYENGISPIKRPHPHFSEIPKFYPRWNPVSQAMITINAQEKGRTVVLENIESTAIANLDEKYAGLIAKKIAGIASKELVGAAVAHKTDSPLLGFAVKMALYLSDQADVRSWNLLPKDLQILRIPIEEGIYHVEAYPLGLQPLPEKIIQVKAGRKAFVSFRYMP